MSRINYVFTRNHTLVEILFKAFNLAIFNSCLLIYISMLSFETGLLKWITTTVDFRFLLGVNISFNDSNKSNSTGK